MSTHKRESIIANIVAALQSIVNVGKPVADAGNSAPPDGLVVETSGNFTHTTKTNYLVQVTTGGVSGAAKVAITDTSTGTDTVALAQTVTSGADISLGTRGGKIRFSLGAAEVLTFGDKWTVACDVFNTTAKEVKRVRAAGVTVDAFPSWVVAEAPQDYDSVDGNKYVNKMRVQVEGWAEEYDKDVIGATLTKMLQDAEAALAYDPSRGGFAFDTRFVRNEPGVPIEGRPFGVISIEIEVEYHQTI